LHLTRFHLKWLVIAYTALIILLSVMPVNSHATSATLNGTHIFRLRLDYLLHAALYIPWVILIWLFTRFSFRSGWLKALTYLAFCLFFAALMEYLQLFVPSRTFNYLDLSSNITGVTLGFLLLLFFKN
jgi:VanZ family protein